VHRPILLDTGQDICCGFVYQAAQVNQQVGHETTDHLLFLPAGLFQHVAIHIFQFALALSQGASSMDTASSSFIL